MNNITTSIHYLNNVYNLSFSQNDKIGKIQENILKKCMLIIYNIEHTKLFLTNTEFTLGEHNCPFSLSWIDFLKLNNIKEDENIIRFEVYDRKRDEKGCVIKENIIIDAFQKYVQDEESENFLRSFENESNIYQIRNNLNSSFRNNPFLNLENIINSTFENRDIATNIADLQPLSLEEILTPLINSTVFTQSDNTITPNIQVVSSVINVEEESKEETDREESDEEEVEEVVSSESIRINHIINEELNDISDLVNNYVQTRRNRSNQTRNIIRELVNSSSELNILNELNSLVEINESEESIEEEDNENEDEETKEERPIPLRRMFDRGMIQYFNTANNIINSQNITFRNMNSINNIFNPFLFNGSNIINFGSFNNFNDDVKIQLTPEEFDQLEKSEYKDMIKLENITECTICTDSFKDNDLVVKTPCEHIFHLDCIKPWLCNESNKCPVCRKDVAKGKPNIENPNLSTLDEVE